MKAAPRAALVWVASVAAAGIVHHFSGRWLAGRDVIAGAIAGDLLRLAVVAGALAIARLFLFLLAPAWALHIAATVAWAHRPRGAPPRSR